MGIPGGWKYDTPGSAWESEWNDAQSRGATGSDDGVTYYRSAKGSEFALDNKTDTTEAGWGSKGVPPQYQMLLASAGDRQRGLLHGRNLYAAPTEAPQAAPAAPELDTAKIKEANDRAALAKQTYGESIPTYDTGKDPYTAASQYGRDMQNSLLKYQDFADAKAGAQTTEISEASRQALGRFGGKVADYQLPKWRDYLNA